MWLPALQRTGCVTLLYLRSLDYKMQGIIPTHGTLRELHETCSQSPWHEVNVELAERPLLCKFHEGDSIWPDPKAEVGYGHVCACGVFMVESGPRDKQSMVLTSKQLLKKWQNPLLGGWEDLVMPVLSDSKVLYYFSSNAIGLRNNY